MRHFEISGNLEDEINLDFNNFCQTICKVRNYYIEIFGDNVMNSIDLLVDNATYGSGYTPIITKILNKYLVIKLNIKKGDSSGKIIFQFAHELMHYVYYAKKGLDKQRADILEEGVCTAASLIVIKELQPYEFEMYNNHVKGLAIECYRIGAQIAENVQYNMKELEKMID